jgi:hypothetical protein
MSVNRNTVDQSDNNQQNAEGAMDTMGASADRQQIKDLSDAKHGAQDSGVAKRTAKIVLDIVGGIIREHGRGGYCDNRTIRNPARITTHCG